MVRIRKRRDWKTWRKSFLRVDYVICKIYFDKSIDVFFRIFNFNRYYVYLPKIGENILIDKVL